MWYFTIFVCSIFRFIQDGSTFVHMLSLGSLQFCGFVKNAKLPKLSEFVKSTTPKVDVDHPLSLAAGKDLEKPIKHIYVPP